MPKIYKDVPSLQVVIEGYEAYPLNALTASAAGGTEVIVEDIDGNEVDTWDISEVFNSVGSQAGVDVTSTLTYLLGEFNSTTATTTQGEMDAAIAAAIAVPSTEVVTGTGTGIQSYPSLTYNGTNGALTLNADGVSSVRLRNSSTVQYSSIYTEYTLTDTDPTVPNRYTLAAERALAGSGVGGTRLFMREYGGTAAPGFRDFLRFSSGQLMLNGANTTGIPFLPVRIDAGGLDVVDQVKIRGGVPGTGKVLTSDAAGLATWEPIPALGSVGEHTDVDTATSTPSDGDLLSYNSASGNWVPLPNTVTTTQSTNVDVISGRIYCYTNNRWICMHDDNYGTNYYQYNEDAGTGTEPILEWQHQGSFLPAGSVIKRIILTGRMSSTEITDMEISIRVVEPDAQSRWETGIDSDGEINNTEISRSFLRAATGSEPAHTGATNDKRRRTIDINHTVVNDSEFRIYMKPTGSITATRYYLMSAQVFIQYPTI